MVTHCAPPVTGLFSYETSFEPRHVISNNVVF